MFPKSDFIENRGKASVYEPPKLLFEVSFFYNKYLWGIKRPLACLTRWWNGNAFYCGSRWELTTAKYTKDSGGV